MPPGPVNLLTINGEPPSWDAFSKVNVSKIDPSEYEDDVEAAMRKAREEQKKKDNAVVKAKSTVINGWDPETKTQRILTDEDMQNGGGMGAMDFDHWRVTALTKRDVGKTYDASMGERKIMKKLLEAGKGVTNPTPPFQAEITYVGRVRDADAPADAQLLFDEEHWEVPIIVNLAETEETYNVRTDHRFPMLRPPGLVRAVRTMLPGERAHVTVLPEEGFGSEGDESLGVPPDAFLEFDVHLHRVIRVSTHDNGGIVKRTLRFKDGAHEPDMDTPSTCNAQSNYECVVHWVGVLVEDSVWVRPGEKVVFKDTDEAFREAAEERFWLGDPATPKFWAHVLGTFKLGETAELTMDAQAAFGTEGSVKYNVPRSCAIRVTATLVDVVKVDDLSEGKDRSMLHKVRTEGLTTETPIKRYECKIDYTATVIPPPPLSLPEDPAAQTAEYEAMAPTIQRTGEVVTIGKELADAHEQREACGGIDVSAALQALLPKMSKGQVSELILWPCLERAEGDDADGEEAAWPPPPKKEFGPNGEEIVVLDAPDEANARAAASVKRERMGHAVRLVVTCHSWVRVNEVPGTGGLVLKRQLYEGYVRVEEEERNILKAGCPPPESICRVRYIIRAAKPGAVERAEWAAPAGWDGEAEGELVVATAGDEPSVAGAVSDEGETYEFMQGERVVLPCIDAAVLAMRRGERALITAPASCGFMAPNFPPAEAIEPAQRARDVEVVLELVDYDRAPDENGMLMPLKMKIHQKRKEAGNRLFGLGALREAVAKWELAEETLPETENNLRYDLSKGRPKPTEEEIEERLKVCQTVQLACRQNLAAVYIKLDEPRNARKCADKALNIDENSVKALFRRGQAKMRIPPVDVEDVKADLLKAAKLDPKNKDIRNELENLKVIQAQQKKEEAQFFGNFFAKDKSHVAKWEAPKPAVPKKKLEGFATTAFGSRSN